jgi:hypothetical protein
MSRDSNTRRLRSQAPSWSDLGLKLALFLWVVGMAMAYPQIARADSDSWYDVAPEAYQLTPPSAGQTGPNNPYANPPGYGRPAVAAPPAQAPAPPKMTRAEKRQARKGPTPSAASNNLAPESANGGKQWWQVWKPEPPPPVKADTYVPVGPREFPSSPDPLLRLGFNVRQGSKIVSGGVYLVHLAANDMAGTSSLTLLRGSVPMLVVPSHKLTSSASGPMLGPVEALPEAKNRHTEQINRGPYRTVSVSFDPGRRSVTLLYQVGSVFYQSEPLAIAY